MNGQASTSPSHSHVESRTDSQAGFDCSNQRSTTESEKEKAASVGGLSERAAQPSQLSRGERSPNGQLRTDRNVRRPPACIVARVCLTYGHVVSPHAWRRCGRIYLSQQLTSHCEREAAIVRNFLRQCDARPRAKGTAEYDSQWIVRIASRHRTVYCRPRCSISSATGEIVEIGLAVGLLHWIGSVEKAYF